MFHQCRQRIDGQVNRDDGRGGPGANPMVVAALIAHITAITDRGYTALRPRGSSSVLGHCGKGETAVNDFTNASTVDENSAEERNPGTRRHTGRLRMVGGRACGAPHATRIRQP